MKRGGTMVSIIVPVYNIEKYLPVCAESLIRQTYTDLEILLVDDGSTDGSGVLCDLLAAHDQRIKVIHKKNGGLSDARNAGLDQASGEWVLFVDGDDYLAADAVERLEAIGVELQADFVQFHYQETENGLWQPPADQQAEPEVCTDPAQMFRRAYALGGVGASACTKLWHRGLFENLRFCKGRHHEDEELLNRILPLCRRAVYTKLVLYGYVIRPGSLVHSGFRAASMDILAVLDARIPILERLGCDDLVRGTYSWQFRSAAWQYCLAKKGGFTSESVQLKKRLAALAKVPGLDLSGQYMLLYRMTKICPAAPELYYLIRKVCGKV